jgi:dihydrodipicolinate synthase/N-acetylneuraminate lyase
VLAAIGPQGTPEGQNLNFAVSASDPDGTTPALTTSTLPIGAIFTDNGDGTGTFDWTPDFTQDGIYPVTFYAGDGFATDSEIVTITVADLGNQTPVLTAIPDATIPTLSTSTLPTGAAFVDNGDGSGTFDWTPDYTQSSTYEITFYASDGVAIDSEIVSVTVNEAGNQAPILATIGSQATTEGINLDVAITAGDPDGTTPTLTTSVLPTGATFTDNGDGTGNLGWTPDFTQSGSYFVIFYATDAGLAADSEIVSITVNDAGNQTPVLATIGGQSVTEGLNLNFAVSATDPDGTTPSLSTSALPSGAIFTDNGDGTGYFDWTPDYTESGSYDVTFYAFDGAATDSELVTVTVVEAGNQAPVLTSVGARSTTEGIQLLFDATATDPDGTIPSLDATSLPAGATFTDNGDGSGTFDWTPNYVQTGTYAVNFRASDGLEVDSEIVSITVIEAGNQNPVLAAIGSQSTDENVQLTFVVSATDPEGAVPTLTTSALPGGATFVDNGNGTGTFDWIPDFTQSGDYSVTFRTSDGLASDSEIVSISVIEAGNQMPVLAAIGARSTTEDIQLNFTVSATDPDGTVPALSTSALPSGATFVVNNGTGTATFDWTPTFVQSGLYSVTFYADDGLATDSEVVAITVNEAGNQTPVLATIGSRAVTEGINLAFSVSGSDPDGTTPALTTSTMPAGATFVDNLDGTGSFDWTPGFAQSGTYNVTFYADDGLAIDSEIVTISVNEAGNQTPVLAAIGPQSTNESIPLAFSVSASDLDGTIPILSATGLPTGATFTNNGDGTGDFAWTPDFNRVNHGQ